MPFTAEVLDTAYVEVNDAHVEAHITSPTGKTADIPMEWTVEHDGEYGAVFNPDEPGLYEIKVTATRDQKELGSSVMHLRVSAGDGEYYDAAMRATLLKRIAEETGGALLHARQRRLAAGGHQLQRPRRHGRRRTRTVGHAGAADPAAGAWSAASGHSGARGDWRDGRLNHEVTKARRSGTDIRRVFVSFAGYWIVVLTALFLGAPAIRAAAQDSHILVVTGVAGDEEHAKQFHAWALKLIDAAKTKDGVPDANITYLAEKTEIDAARIRGRSTRENVDKAVADIAAKAKPGDQVVIVLIGHGSFDGTVGAFSMPGPDLTACRLGGAAEKARPRRRWRSSTPSSSSGAFLPTVAAPGRTVVTATKTGGERNEAKFGEFFVEAFGDAGADADRNGHVSVLEAFNYANNKVDQGLRAGRPAAHRARGDRRRRRRQAGGTQFLTAHPADGGLKVDVSDPAMRALVAEREAIQKEIDALKMQEGHARTGPLRSGDGAPADEPRAEDESDPRS